ncbi:hypothetical protein [Bartonella sp. B17]
MARPAIKTDMQLGLVDKVSKPIAAIQKKWRKFSRDLRLRQLNKSFKNMTQSVKNLNSAFSQTMGRASKLTALLGLGGGGLVTTMALLGNNVSKAASELDKFSKLVGVDVETMQELIYAGEKFDISNSSMVDGLKSLNKSAYEFALTGKGGAAEAFRALGISATNMKGKLKNPVLLFDEIIERMSKLDNQTQIDLSSKIFGGNNDEFLRLMGQTHKQLISIYKEARQSGTIFSKASVERANAYQSSLQELSVTLSGLKKRLAIGLLPSLENIIKVMNQWLKTNKEWIQTKLTSALKWLEQTIKDLLNPASDLRQNIESWRMSFVNFFKKLEPIVTFMGGPFKATLMVLGFYIAGPMVMAVGSLSISLLKMAGSIGVTVLGSLGKLFAGLNVLKVVAGGSLIKVIKLLSVTFLRFGITLMTTPVGWIIAGIAAVVAIGVLLYKNWDKIVAWFGPKLKALGAWFSNFGSYVSEMISNLLENIKGFFTKILGFLKDIDWLGIATGMITEFYNGIVSKFSSICEFFANIGSLIWSAISSAARIWSSIGSKIINFIWDGLKSGWINVKSWFSSAIGKFTSWMPNWMKAKLGIKVDTSGVKNTTGDAENSINSLAANIDGIKSYKAAVPMNGSNEGAFCQPLQTQKTIINNTIDATVRIEALNINNPDGSPAKIKALIESMLAKFAAEQRRALASSLSD